MEALEAIFGEESAVRIDGTVIDADDRMAAVDAFQKGAARFFVANPQAAGTGLTLTAAKVVVYYNNSWSYGDRAQSEDRAHRIGQKDNVLYIDLCAVGTIDEDITRALRKKKNFSCEVLGDEVKAWI